jgi:hypothetical protein
MQAMESFVHYCSVSHCMNLSIMPTMIVIIVMHDSVDDTGSESNIECC